MSSNFLLYDGECPACRSYLAIARLRELWPDLRILDARKEPDLVAELRAKGLEINDGFVLSLDGTLYFGPDATRMIGERGRDQRGLRSFVLCVIGTAPWSRRLYPWLNRGRQLLLATMGKSLIR